MKHALLAAALALPFYAGLTASATAQAPAARPAGEAPPAAAGGAAARAARPINPGGHNPGGASVFMSISEYPSNKQSGVNADQFIGYPDEHSADAFNGMRIQSMLRAGDPYHPGVYGSVLEYRDLLAVATLAPHGESPSATSKAVSFYYVQGGKGTVDSGPGTKSYDLHNGVGVLFGAGAKQHFVNTGDEPLSMILLSWTDNGPYKAKQDLKVVDTVTEPLNPGGVHWIMAGRKLFDTPDGIELVSSAIVIPKGTYSGPHAHGHGAEEIWVKTGFDVGYAILGSDIRKCDGPCAFLAPPNGLTVHSSMNLSDHDEVWLYLAWNGRPGQSPGPGAPERPARAPAAAAVQ